jgi:hypothetical protein
MSLRFPRIECPFLYLIFSRKKAAKEDQEASGCSTSASDAPTKDLQSS